MANRKRAALFFHFTFLWSRWMLSWLAPCVMREHNKMRCARVWARVRKVLHKETGVLRAIFPNWVLHIVISTRGWRGNGVGDGFASFSSLGIGIGWCFQLDMRNLNKSRRACKVHRHTHEINPLLRASRKWASIAYAVPIRFHGSHRIHVSDK